MEKFILLTIGFIKPTPEIMEEWTKWFQSIGDKLVEQVGLMNGREVRKDEVKDLPMDLEAITGYLVIQAENIEEATKIAEQCPMITSTKVYQVMKH